MTERRILETTQLLGALPPDTLEVLRQQSTVRTVARNEVLFRQGDPSSELFGIVNGKVAILTRSPDGRESLVAVLDEGSLFGELGLVRRRPALGRCARPRGDQRPRARLRRRAQRDRRTPDVVVDHRAHARPTPAQHRRVARRRGVPRRSRAHRQATARDRGRRRPVPAADDPGGSGRARRREPASA